MREILFRGKRRDNKKWYYGSYLFLHLPSHDWTGRIVGHEEDVHFIESKDGINIAVDPTTIGQYTGLTDKNGMNIFEGDIVKLSYVDENDDELTADWFAVVEFGNPNGKYNWGFQLRPISTCRLNSEILLWVDMEETGAYCEVIGNIHDNPAFLEVGHG